MYIVSLKILSYNWENSLIFSIFVYRSLLNNVVYVRRGKSHVKRNFLTKTFDEYGTMDRRLWCTV